MRNEKLPPAAFWAILSLFMAILALTIISTKGRSERIEIPLRIDRENSKRVPGLFEFLVVFWTPQGKLAAIPEDDVAQYVALAEEEGLDPMEIGFMPPQAALSTVANVTIEIEEAPGIRFWRDDYGIWITWDEDHPAPIATVDGVEIAWETPDPALIRGPRRAVVR